MPQDRLTDIWNVLKASALASNDAHKECIIYCTYNLRFLFGIKFLKFNYQNYEVYFMT